MEKKTYMIEGLPHVGPYSNVVEAGGFLFVSGTLPVDTINNISVKENVSKATELILNNIKKALAECGSSIDQIVKTTVFLKDMADFNEMNEAYKTFFPVAPPARSCIAVKAIPGDYPVEIEAIAIKK
ncbi:MAG TPA: RidA family protein [Desulfomonilia bacterium]